MRSVEMAVRIPSIQRKIIQRIPLCTASTIDTDGAPIDTSSTIIIENTAPTIDAFSISPSTSVEANVTLEMIYSASDIDAETLNVSFTWVDDTGLSWVQTQRRQSITGVLLVQQSPPRLLSQMDMVALTQPTETITILNTAPTVSSPASISASPSPITTGVLTCSASFSDYNDGSLTPSYAWTLLDGTPLAAIGDTLTIDPTQQTLQMRLSARHLQRTMMVHSISSSTSIVIQNTAPTD